MTDGKWSVKVDPIDPQAIAAQLNASMVTGLNTWLRIVSDKARQKAPVRRVFRSEMHERRTSWRNVAAGHDEATALANFRQMQGGLVASQGRNIRVKLQRGEFVVQQRSWKTQGPTPPAHSAWRPSQGEQGRIRLNAMTTSGPAFEREMTSRARWAYREALRNWRDVGQDDWRYTDMDEQRGARSRKKVKPVSGGIRESMLVNVMPGENGEAHAEDRLGALTGATKTKTAVVQMGGTLRKSIRPIWATIEGTRITGRVAAEVRYARFVEYGTTTRGRAQPFLRPALHESRRQLARSIGHAVRNGGFRKG